MTGRLDLLLDGSGAPGPGREPARRHEEALGRVPAAGDVPRPDQWIYIQSRDLVPSAIAADKGQNPDSTIQLWMKVDGTKMAGYNPDNGNLDVWDQDNGYPALPTDPAALLALLRAQLGAIPSGDPMPPHPQLPANEEEWSVALFGRIAHILDGNLVPPDVTAALWRAAALIPGVTEASETVDGRALTAGTACRRHLRGDGVPPSWHRPPAVGWRGRMGAWIGRGPGGAGSSSGPVSPPVGCGRWR